MTVRLLAPAPYWQGQTFSGTSYAADSEGRINAAIGDVRDLLNSGCLLFGMGTSDVLLGSLIGANMNVTTDQAVALPYLPAGVKWQPRRITVRNASISLTTAAGGVYDAASKGGNAIVAAAQAYSALTAAAKSLDLTLALNIVEAATVSQLYLALTTAQGAAATADVYVYGELVF
jgi:hypothetical protein